MNIHKWIHSRAALTLGVIASCGYANALAATNEPFNGSMKFQAKLGSNADPSCPFIGSNTGEGVTTHLGNVTMASTECVLPDSPAMINLNAYQGTMALVAPNGDMLTANYRGLFRLAADGRTYMMSGMTFSITGGKGRFIHATGSGTLQGSQDAVTGQGSFTASGTISY